MANLNTRQANSNGQDAGSSPCTSEAHQKANIETMTREQWQRLHRDFKSTIDGKCFVLRCIPGMGTCLVPVKIV